ncbi:MAG: peptide deformylase [Deltaproteobacteria bacterium]|nr:peptide deformylase [Deltaproteobacteria bacterium]
MAVRPILLYPDKRLRLKAEPVGSITAEVRALADDLAETMYAAPGVGLAAPQVGVSLRMFVVDIAPSDAPSDLRTFINPRFVRKEAEVVWEEGCLSFPGIHADIERAAKITIQATGVDGRDFELTCEELLAVAIQHEYDHLDGVLMVDHVSLLRRRAIERELKKRTYR